MVEERERDVDQNTEGKVYEEVGRDTVREMKIIKREDNAKKVGRGKSRE